MPRTISKVAVASGDLEKAVLECRQLASDYESDAALGLDLVAVLRLLAKVGESSWQEEDRVVRMERIIVCGINTTIWRELGIHLLLLISGP